MASVNPFKKKKPGEGLGAQSAEDIKQSVGYPGESNLDTDEPFLPGQPVPRKMGGAAQAQQQQQSAAPDAPDFLSPQAESAAQGEPGQYGAPYETPAQEDSPETFEDILDDYEEVAEGQAPAPAPNPQAPEQHSAEASSVHKIATTAVDGLRHELESKIDALDDEISNLKTLEANVLKIEASLSGVEGKYAELSKKAAEMPEKVESEIDEIKACVDSMNATLSKALPALIKEIRSLKTPSLQFGQK